MSCTSRELTRVGNRRLLTPDEAPLTPLVSQPWEPSELAAHEFQRWAMEQLARSIRLSVATSETQVMWGNK